MNMPSALIELALHRALKAYGGKVDKAGKPYILHPLRLAARLDDPIAQCVALLHDVIEDSPQLLTICLTMDFQNPPACQEDQAVGH